MSARHAQVGDEVRVFDRRHVVDGALAAALDIRTADFVDAEVVRIEVFGQLRYLGLRRYREVRDGREVFGPFPGLMIRWDCVAALHLEHRADLLEMSWDLKWYEEHEHVL